MAETPDPSTGTPVSYWSFRSSTPPSSSNPPSHSSKLDVSSRKVLATPQSRIRCPWFGGSGHSLWARAWFSSGLGKQTISNYIWLQHQHQQNLGKREFSLVMVFPHTAEPVSLTWDDTWRETLVAQSIPFNIGLLQLEVRLSQDYMFYPRLANQPGAIWSHHIRRDNSSIWDSKKDLWTFPYIVALEAVLRNFKTRGDTIHLQ